MFLEILIQNCDLADRTGTNRLLPYSYPSANAVDRRLTWRLIGAPVRPQRDSHGPV